MDIRSARLAVGLLVALSMKAPAAEWAMPDPLPGAPAGENTAAFPTPKLDWVERVKATNARAHQSAAEIAVVFDGDSITDGWQSAGREVWNARYAKHHAFDFGISGDRTEHVLWRLAQGQVDGLHPRLVLLMIGTNNLGRNTNDEIAAGIAGIVASYRKRCPDAVIVLQGIFPRGQKAEDPARARITAINSTIARVADGVHVVFTDFGAQFLAPDGTLSPEIMPDFLHPSRKGYEIWADAIQALVDAHLGR